MDEKEVNSGVVTLTGVLGALIDELSESRTINPQSFNERMDILREQLSELFPTQQTPAKLVEILRAPAPKSKEGAPK